MQKFEPLINVTIPVYNEEKQLAHSVRRLWNHLVEHCRFSFEIVIADNGSTDGTPEAARRLAAELHCVRCYFLRQKGRGRALKAAWTSSRADVLSYMDVDLSTDLAAFPPLVEAVLSEGFDLAAGSRLLKPAWTTRGLKRETISRGYNALIRLLFQRGFSDAQCGFKAISQTAAAALLPMVQDNAWFFDTELLLLAESQGYRIFDLPVRWKDDPESTVRLIPTIMEDLKGLARMRTTLRGGRDQKAPPSRPVLAGGRFSMAASEIAITHTERR